jgi:hypothetical protein
MPVDEGDGSASGWYTLRWAEQQLGRPVPEGGVGSGFAVDPERAQECIDDLTRIVNDVRAATVTKSLQFTPPGNDEVSVNLALNATVMAGRAEQAVQTWADQIEATRNALREQLAAYRAVDGAVVERLA